MEDNAERQNDYRNGNGNARSWFKEILGTFFGAAPYVLALLLWGSTVQERLRVTEIRLDHAEQAVREQRIELVQRLDRLSTQIETVQQLLASRTLNR